MTAEQVKLGMAKLADPQKAEREQYFFKTQAGGYGAGDRFIGLSVPAVRAVAKDFKDLSMAEVRKLLTSPIHEHRQAALIIITNRAKRADQAGKKRLYDFYMAHTNRINNWDLVDISCRDVVGGYLIDKSRQPLYELARSENIWERRIAIVSTWAFIRQRDLADTFKISEMLMTDKHDLIHKAVGWMLREAGKRDRPALLGFLDKHAHELPRTALRYSIEHLPLAQKLHYMQAKTSVK